MKIIKDFRKSLPSKEFCNQCSSDPLKYIPALMGGLLFHTQYGTSNSNINYVIYTPCGADYTTCPICGSASNFYDNQELCDKYYEETEENTYIYDWDYCEKCNILFNKEIHGVNGCTDNSYTAVFISKFKWNSKIYEGMPQLNTSELFNILKNDIQFEILETVSSNTLPVPSRYCKKAYYPYKLDKNN